MSTLQPQQEIFKVDQYFWCHEGNESIKNWLSTNQDFPHIYATYINDANAVVRRRRAGKPIEHDKHMLAFLEQYPMTSANVVDEFTWYKTNVLEKKDWTGVYSQKKGLIDVYTYGSDPQVVGQARDLLYKQVFDHSARHNHWVQRGEHGFLNPNEVEPLSKQQKSMIKSQARWAKMDERRAAKEAAGPTGDISRLLSALEVRSDGGNQNKAEEDVEMEE
ncbi:hypothetical protein E4T48_06679 [Aureobasidium sp. EXF-10727]|nr:hypothetical protein E4T48_06679 [Aureobasidium sp. EXF-10727]